MVNHNNLDTELRDISLSFVKNLGVTLSDPYDWKRLMGYIPSEREDRDKRFENLDITYVS